jgi:hypothetical protein
MALQGESATGVPIRQTVEAWVWPLTAAIVLGGSILFWSLAALFWMAVHPAEKSVVIWMAPSEMQTEQLENALGSVPKRKKGWLGQRPRCFDSGAALRSAPATQSPSGVLRQSLALTATLENPPR